MPNTREIALEQADIELAARSFLEADDLCKRPHREYGQWASARSPKVTHLALDDFAWRVTTPHSPDDNGRPERDSTLPVLRSIVPAYLPGSHAMRAVRANLSWTSE
jgi:hypothetical protein